VQNKVETLIDEHMQSIGASKTSLSSITTEMLWRQSGRYSANSELLRINDRRESGFLLSPTHEEEITALVAGMVHSYKDLPLRLYQIGRKYRDERRPRQGLLRAKEFVMKDLYTFDYSPEAALETYEAVRQAYSNLFTALKLPYLVADADSGNMGGKLSHEYHFVSPKGEDNVWSCDSCSYVANEELIEKKSIDAPTSPDTLSFEGISTDRKTRITIRIPKPDTRNQAIQPSWDLTSSYVNLHAVKKALPPEIELDTGIEASTLKQLLEQDIPKNLIVTDRSLSKQPDAIDITLTAPGAACPHCRNGKLDVQKAIEIGHTFHLGTRYSAPLNALIAMPSSPTKQPMQMGCHGIGVSRLIGAIASLLSDSRGLNWPRVIAPYEAIILSTPHVEGGEPAQVYDALHEGGERGSVDVVMDDRVGKSLGWKLKDADLIGYPVIVVLGRGWKEKREVEVQCRRLGVKKEVGLSELRAEVLQLLEQL
jgi:prolyl-tRNA synthetase